MQSRRHPAPGVAADLRARTLEQDRGSRSTRAGWATDEVIGLTREWIAKTLAQELPTRKTEHR